MALNSDVRMGSIERELSNTTVSLSTAFPRAGAGELSSMWNSQKKNWRHREHITRDGGCGLYTNDTTYHLQ